MAQRIRPPRQDTNTVNLFASAQRKQGFVTAKDSKQFLKRVTAVTISSVAYLRGMFPEDSFGVKELEGLQIKVLKAGEDQHPNARALIEQLTSIFHVIETADLRKLELDVYSGPECVAEQLLEVWLFRYGYKPDASIRDDTAGGETPRWLVDVPDDSLDGTRSSTLQMLRTLLFTAQAMLPLDAAVDEGSDQPCCYLVMRITTETEEGSPDVEIDGFHPDPDGAAAFVSDTVKVKIGTIPTKHAGIKCAVKAQPHMFGFGSASEAGEHGHALDQDSQDFDERPAPVFAAPAPPQARQADVKKLSLKKSKLSKSSTTAAASARSSPSSPPQSPPQAPTKKHPSSVSTAAKARGARTPAGRNKQSYSRHVRHHKAPRIPIASKAHDNNSFDFDA